MSNDEHGNLGAIFTRVPNLMPASKVVQAVRRRKTYLAGFEIIWVEALDLSLTEWRDAPTFRPIEVIVRDRSRSIKATHSDKKPGVSVSAMGCHGAHKVRKQTLKLFATVVIDVELILDLEWICEQGKIRTHL